MMSLTFCWRRRCYPNHDAESCCMFFPIGFPKNARVSCPCKRYADNKGVLDPVDIVGTLVYLISDLAAYVNGQNIVVDDGWSK